MKNKRKILNAQIFLVLTCLLLFGAIISLKCREPETQENYLSMLSDRETGQVSESYVENQFFQEVTILPEYENFPQEIREAIIYAYNMSYHQLSTIR